MKEKNYDNKNINYDNRINRLKTFLPNVFKAMWAGGASKETELVNENDIARFNNVIDSIHYREEKANAYKDSIHADTKGGAIQRNIEDREQDSKKRVAQDRAD